MTREHKAEGVANALPNCMWTMTCTPNRTVFCYLAAHLMLGAERLIRATVLQHLIAQSPSAQRRALPTCLPSDTFTTAQVLE
eukprot:9344440-Pyramimonas_sp.AAC.1